MSTWIGGGEVLGEAPGRLDFLGGVADYSGSLVLQTPTQNTTRVWATYNDEAQMRVASTSQGEFAVPKANWDDLMEVVDAACASTRAWMDELDVPQWARYSLGCMALFCGATDWRPQKGISLRIESDVPLSMGVSSSAALEVATLRALEVAWNTEFFGTGLARLAQTVENEIVGAPCGLMDQLASAHGKPGALLPIVCRPDILGEPIPLPTGVTIVGWPSGVQHAVSDSPYATARTAAFMGKKILQAHFNRGFDFVTELAPSEVRGVSEAILPPHMTGADFLARFGGVDDALSSIEPARVYPVRAGVLFPIEENARCQLAAALLRGGDSADLSLVGELMFQSHAGYSTIGLGHPQTDAMVETVRALGAEDGFYGARVSGGGSGGTVVVLARQEALDSWKMPAEFPSQLIQASRA
jgi:L-arabinokinase